MSDTPDTPGSRGGAVQHAAEWLLGDTEPVRRALYPVVVALVALLVGYGVIAGERAGLWLAVVVAILGPGATEAARQVAWAPSTVFGYADGWEGHAREEYARGVATGCARTPELVAQEPIDDEPGEHAVDREPATAAIRAPSRAARCREVDSGMRCYLTREHEGPHRMTI